MTAITQTIIPASNLRSTEGFYAIESIVEDLILGQSLLFKMVKDYHRHYAQKNFLCVLPEEKALNQYVGENYADIKQKLAIFLKCDEDILILTSEVGLVDHAFNGECRLIGFTYEHNHGDPAVGERETLKVTFNAFSKEDITAVFGSTKDTGRLTTYPKLNVHQKFDNAPSTEKNLDTLTNKNLVLAQLKSGEIVEGYLLGDAFGNVTNYFYKNYHNIVTECAHFADGYAGYGVDDVNLNIYPNEELEHNYDFHRNGFILATKLEVTYRGDDPDMAYLDYILDGELHHISDGEIVTVFFSDREAQEEQVKEAAAKEDAEAKASARAAGLPVMDDFDDDIEF